MKYLCIAVLINFFISSLAQKFTGQIIDSTENKPISYVNIGIENRNIGTVSDENGFFEIELNEKENNDTIRISSIGYYEKRYSVKDFMENFYDKGSAKLNLVPRSYPISQVLVTSKAPKFIMLGNRITNNHNYILTDSFLGSEIGLIIKIPNKKKSYLLKDLTFHLAPHRFATEVRVNVYYLNKSIPAKNILNEPIYVIIPSRGEKISVDLSKFNIRVSEDFFIGIEHFREIPSDDKRLKYMGVLSRKSDGLYRMVSQGEWSQLPSAEIQLIVKTIEYPE